MRWKTFSATLWVALILATGTLTLAITASAEYKVLYKFTMSEGAFPYSVIVDAAGNLYGTTQYGGAYGGGTAFKLTPQPDGSWKRSKLHNFNGADGQCPDALIFDATGNLYGTTFQGGAYGQGTAFRLALQPDGGWKLRNIHRFNIADGANSFGGLMFDAAGALYGTTKYGGAYGWGTVFKLTPQPDGSWKRSKLHYFNRGDGAAPLGGLVSDGNGNLYGTTTEGGGHGYGTVFKLTLQPDGVWKLSSIHDFSGADGADPAASLIFDAVGNLYGTTTDGGAYARGTVFKLTPQPGGNWKLSTLHSFNGADGASPFSGLVVDAADSLYGTTYYGGAYGHGTAFRLTPQPDGSWTESVLHSFDFTDGDGPLGMTFDAAGNLYGVTWWGGDGCDTYGCGVIFEITP